MDSMLLVLRFSEWLRVAFAIMRTGNAPEHHHTYEQVARSFLSAPPLIVMAQRFSDKLRKFVNSFGELKVVLAQTTDFMRDKLNSNTGKDVRPFRMMTHTLCDQSNFGHKSKSGYKI